MLRRKGEAPSPPWQVLLVLLLDDCKGESGLPAIRDGDGAAPGESWAGSPRLWVWGVALQRTRGGISREDRWHQLPRVAGGRQSAEAAQAPGRQKHLNLPCFYGEKVVSTEHEHGHAGSTQSPSYINYSMYLRGL